jgi:hypothetical protein
MTKNVETLRIVAKFLRLCAEGYCATPEEFKTMSNLCWLCVPMKFRMSREEMTELHNLIITRTENLQHKMGTE